VLPLTKDLLRPGFVPGPVEEQLERGDLMLIAALRLGLDAEPVVLDALDCMGGS
jgi:hypothetical protein